MQSDTFANLPYLSLVILYISMIAVNVIVSGFLWRADRNLLRRDLFLNWIGVFLSLVVQGPATTYTQAMFGFSSSFIVSMTQSHLTAKLAKTTLPYRLCVVLCITGILLGAFIHLFFNPPMFIWGIPICLGVGFPCLFVTWNTIRGGEWRKLSVSVKTLVIANFIYYLNVLDFSYMRDKEALGGIALTSALIIVFAVSIVAPAAVAEAIATETTELRLEKETLKKNMEITGAVQQLLVPQLKSGKTSRGLFSTLFQPAEESGGDWWWIETLQDGRTIILVGDVTGHGPGPAMMTAVVTGAFLSLKNSDQKTLTLKQIAANLDQVFKQVSADTYYMTLTAIEIAPEGTSLRWLLAGAPPIFIQRQDGKIESILAPSGRLGDQGASYFQEGETHLSPKDRVFVFTDGLFEVALPSRGRSGVKRLRETLGKLTGKSTDFLRDELISEIDQLEKGRKQLSHEAQMDLPKDDFTLVAYEPTHRA